jgi:hypothetical protein
MRQPSTAFLTAAAVAVTLAAPFAAAPATAQSASPSKNVMLHGRFSEVAIDGVHKESTAYFVKVKGDLYRLRGVGDPHLKTGQQVDIVGTRTDKTVQVSSIAPATAAPAAAGPTSAKVLVELVYWTSPDSAVTPATAQHQYAVTDSAWFSKDSYGALTGMTAQATNWLQIAAPSDPDGAGGNTACDNIGTIESEGDVAAQAAGYNLTGFTNIVYYYPTCPGEQWGGWGEVGGSRTWLIGEMDARVSVHELGHNFGLGHSHSEICSVNGATVPYSGTCSLSEYGDMSSAMGAGFSGQGMYSANQQDYLGWLGVGTHIIATVTASGSYSVVPYENSGGGVQALQVTDSSGATFWIEYRQPTENDAFLGTGLTNGVLIKTGLVGYNAQSDIYDMTPATGGDFSDAALPVGATWSNPLGDLNVAVTSATSARATVAISFGTLQYVLSVSTKGTGTGAITSVPSGINCGPTCSASYPSGQSVTLTESPSTGSAFAGWSGACSGNATTCTVSMTAARSAIATFNANSGGTRYEETAAGWDGWKPFNDATVGSMRANTVAAATAKFQFSGTALTWLTKKGPGQGKATVTIDGVSKGTFDLYASTAQPASLSFTGLTSQTHTMVVKVLGTKNANATGTQVVIHGFTVGATTTAPDAKTVTYQTWKAGAAASASGGTYRSSGAANAKSAFSFTGTGIDWITATGPGWGKAGVVIDGVDKGTVDLYAAAAHPQAVKSYTGLGAGSHTITITALGTKNASATSTKVEVDAFVVH